MLDINGFSLLLSVIVTSIAAVKVVDFISPITLLEHGRTSQIDGIRGFLAVFVMLHHSNIWYHYLSTEQWVTPATNLYTNLGQVGVTFFFMITGFLFFTKIRKDNQDWLHLFLSRFLRLTPMFLLSISLLFLIVGWKSNWKIQTPINDLLNSCAKWVGFTIFGSPNINNVKDTFTINAGVAWTLVYEWLFYFSLPVIAFIIRKKVPAILIIATIILCFTIFHVFPIKLVNLLSFAFGFIASLFCQQNRIMSIAKNKLTPILIVLIISYELVTFQTTFSIIPITICGIIFILISAGCSMYGILDTKVARKLGEATYSIYLLHGIFFYLFMNIFITEKPPAHLYFLYVCLISFCVVFISCFTYKFIEQPFIKISSRLVERFRFKTAIR